jgi:hypothetical protein
MREVTGALRSQVVLFFTWPHFDINMIVVVVVNILVVDIGINWQHGLQFIGKFRFVVCFRNGLLHGLECELKGVDGFRSVSSAFVVSNVFVFIVDVDGFWTHRLVFVVIVGIVAIFITKVVHSCDVDIRVYGVDIVTVVIIIMLVIIVGVVLVVVG